MGTISIQHYIFLMHFKGLALKKNRISSRKRKKSQNRFFIKRQGFKKCFFLIQFKSFGKLHKDPSKAEYYSIRPDPNNYNFVVHAPPLSSIFWLIIKQSAKWQETCKKKFLDYKPHKASPTVYTWTTSHTRHLLQYIYTWTVLLVMQ